MKKALVSVISLLLILALLPLSGSAASTEKANVELWNAVKPLETTVTFLNSGAHPDDERSDFLAYLSRGLGVKTSSLIANRGEGGQNEIGDELDNALGIIRSREMIEAAKITGVKAYHLSKTTSDPIYDFGFSKTPEETLAKWGEELTYERLIRFIRTYQPDILMPSFQNDDTQHGHHRTMTILSERAFKDAADPTVFPKQLKQGLSVWQVKKLYLPVSSADQADTSIEIGNYDPIYGMTYPQLGEQSRYLHKSQGMGSDIPAAPRQVHLDLKQSAVDTKNKSDLFAGVPYNFADWAEKLPHSASKLKAEFKYLQRDLDTVVAAYPNEKQIFSKSQTALSHVRKMTAQIKKAKLSSSIKNDLLHKLSLKEEQLQNVSYVSSGLDVQAEAASNILTKGQNTNVTVTVKNNGKQTLKKVAATLNVPKGWQTKTKSKDVNLAPNKSATFTYKVEVPEDASYYHAYDESTITTSISYKYGSTKTSIVEELEGTIAVLPDVGITLSPEDIVVNTADVKEEIPVTVTLKNYTEGKTSAKVTLKVPENWKVKPKKATVSFNEKSEEKQVKFTLTPPKTIQNGEYQVKAFASVNGKTFDSTIQEISYDHIGTFYYQYPSAINTVAFELLMPASLKVGYIESGFDKVADYLSNAGLNITKLTEADLAKGDLSQYDTIVTGIRAYLSREDLKANNARLLEYVENGGHLVVQYHKPGDGWDALTTAPYPLTLGNPSIRWRVTDEKATVNVLKPESALFNYPNKITTDDWNNWVQERGLYFPMKWDDRFETFISMADPNEEPFDGGILMAKYGKGTYLYTNLVLYRQIQGQVPGGYRIMTNLISYGAQ
ncbi:Mycothiol S-conjugate amidase [Peribacillus sp. Bi96]|uniref:NEW3 domain-containing protein n=1 Tax=unclassified Peribacillus TaxID=2675266 RepID=UPI001E0B311D|nr:NEW3 domain-containing protein [Peribacillus sp. Bi96]CAH0251168.1 Mycothiol S-conjugate amidase [Peribacillus sp. Bi96]